MIKIISFEKYIKIHHFCYKDQLDHITFLNIIELQTLYHYTIRILRMSKFYNETLELYTVCKSNETLENLLKYIADHFKYAQSLITIWKKLVKRMFNYGCY